MQTLFKLYIGLLFLLQIFSQIAVDLELFFNIINYNLVQLEGLGKNIRIDWRIRSKDRVCYGDQPKILIAETRKGKSVGLPYVELEVNETNWEYKNISLV